MLQLPDAIGDPLNAAHLVRGLQQVFMNLMLNAMDAIKEMGVAGKLSVTSQQSTDLCERYGVGIASCARGEDLPRVFHHENARQWYGTVD